MAHPDFYNAMIDPTIMGKDVWQPRDFSKVPTKEVFNLYKTYLGKQDATSRLNFRVEHPELDAWMLLTKKVTKPATGRGKKETSYLTPWEEAEKVKRFQELFD